MSTTKRNQATPKDVLLTLMTFVGKEKRSVLENSSGQLAERDYVAYRCPKPGCPIAVISFLAKTGLKNTYTHLKSCYAKGQDDTAQSVTMMRMYEEAKSEMQRNGSHFARWALNDYNKAMHSYIRMITLQNMPLVNVEDIETRNFSRVGVWLSHKTVPSVINQLGVFSSVYYTNPLN